MSAGANDVFHLPRPFGPYTLLRRIAVGGMAEVYVAKAKGLGGFEKLVAIKVIHPRYSEDEQFIHMLVEEAKLSVLLTHVNVGQIFDLGCIDNTYFIVMEYIEGADTYRMMKRASDQGIPIPFELCAFIAAEVCHGLEYAHKRKDFHGRPLSIVHRDISPQNVLVSYSGEVKIVDFGVAKAALRSNQTDAGIIKGKYHYMSPEQASGSGGSVDHRSDIFSVGVVLYELVTGEMLYNEDNVGLLLERVRRASIPPPHQKRADLPSALSEIIMKALARNRDDRYESGQHMGEALTQFVYETSPAFTASKLAEFMNSLFQDDIQDLRDLQMEAHTVSAHVANLEEPSIVTAALPAMRREEFARDPTKSIIFDLPDDEGPTHSEQERMTRERSLSPGDATTSNTTDSLETFPADNPSRTTVRPPGPSQSDNSSGWTKNVNPRRGSESTVSLSYSKSQEEAQSTYSLQSPQRAEEDSTDVSRMEINAQGHAVPVPRAGTNVTSPQVPQVLSRNVSGASAVSAAPTVPPAAPNLLFSPALRTPSKEGLGATPPGYAPYRVEGMPSAQAWVLVDPRTQAEAGNFPPHVQAFQNGIPNQSVDFPAPPKAPHTFGPNSVRFFLIGVAGLLCLGLIALVASLNYSPPALEVISVPAGASVRIDGQTASGVTPMRVSSGIEVGRLHRLEISLPGYETQALTFQPTSGTVKQITVLKPLRATLHVDSSPPGADIYINGVLHGQAPIEVQGLSLGTQVELRASLPGKGEISQPIPITEDNLRPHVLVVLQTPSKPGSR